jgi:bacterioferritin
VDVKALEVACESYIFWRGDVEMVASAEVVKVQDVAKMLDMVIKMEIGSIRDYNLWANEYASNADSGSKIIFKHLVEDEERH